MYLAHRAFLLSPKDGQALDAGADRSRLRSGRCAPPIRRRVSCSHWGSRKIRSASRAISCAPPRQSRATRAWKERAGRGARRTRVRAGAHRKRGPSVCHGDAGARDSRHRSRAASREPRHESARGDRRSGAIQHASAAANAPNMKWRPSARSNRSPWCCCCCWCSARCARCCSACMTLALAIIAALHRRASRLRRSPHPRAGIRIEPHRQRHRLLDPFLRRPVPRIPNAGLRHRPCSTWVLRSCSASRRRWWVTWYWRRCRFRGSSRSRCSASPDSSWAAAACLCLYPVLARARGRLPKFGPLAVTRSTACCASWRWTRAKFVVLAALAVRACVRTRARAGPGRRQGVAAVTRATREPKSSACGTYSAVASKPASSWCRAIRRRLCSRPKSGLRGSSTDWYARGPSRPISP